MGKNNKVFVIESLKEFEKKQLKHFEIAEKNSQKAIEMAQLNSDQKIKDAKIQANQIILEEVNVSKKEALKEAKKVFEEYALLKQSFSKKSDQNFKKTVQAVFNEIIGM